MYMPIVYYLSSNVKLKDKKWQNKSAILLINFDYFILAKLTPVRGPTLEVLDCPLTAIPP